MRIDLIYDSDCPNVAAARDNLRLAILELQSSATWREWERHDPAAPEYVRRYGSPTILVNEIDVSPLLGENSDSCRLYPNPNGGFERAPTAESIKTAITQCTVDRWF